MLSLPLCAQRKVSADVEVKTVAKGKVSTVTKSVYCTRNGRLVTLFRTPVSYYAVSNIKGEVQIYNPSSGEVLTRIDESLSSNTELVMLFMSGHIDDLGLGYFGYKATGTSRDGEYLKKVFTHADPQQAKVEIVYENYLPIYCEYTSPEGKCLGRKYLSEYNTVGRFTLPLRVTDINYGKDRDSTVTRTIYSSVRLDTDDPAFDFTVPADAKPMKLEQQAQ
ncbi:MAG: hypothetical protein J5737_03070 [Bacteroidales bacterium]|nr:hypothetical protein [Bacteroidales bacterium]